MIKGGAAFVASPAFFRAASTAVPMKAGEPNLEYPKMLYRAGDEIEWEGLRLATLIVETAEHESEAAADGWRDLADLLTKAEEKVAKKKAAVK